MKKRCLLILLFLFPLLGISQTPKTSRAVYIDSARVIITAPLSSKPLIPSPEFDEEEEKKEIKQNIYRENNIVPGKGFPKGIDPVLQSQMGEITAFEPSNVINVARELNYFPTDPTGAVGENYYLNAWNRSFAIWDKNGNNVVPASSLESIGGAFNQEYGDPIVAYDAAAERFLILSFATSSEGSPAILVAVSKGADPVNSGWYTYSFKVDAEPDYPKISIWGASYIITTNKNVRSPEDHEVVFALERDKMLQGVDNARILGFPLPGIKNNQQFYSPAGFNVMDQNLPPAGNAPIVYLQDDAWSGVNIDHLKLWLVNANWNNIDASSISLSQEITDGVSAFNSMLEPQYPAFIEQPLGAPPLDGLQGVMMNKTQYRRFSDHNSVVMNFVVNVAPSGGKHAGIRWYELRQNGDGQPWYVYQEGTYAPDSSDRFCGSMALDRYGNIALGFTIVNSSEENPIFPSVMYTGRYINDALGEMSLAEQLIVQGENPFQVENPNEYTYARYGDYAHMSVDPIDGITFWHNAEIMEPPARLDVVGVFRLISGDPNDLGVTALLKPEDATLSNAEAISVKIRNYGTIAQSNFQVSYSINGGAFVNETYTGTIQPQEAEVYTFENTADLSEIGAIYTITVKVNLTNDTNENNDTLVKEVKNLPPNDVGVNTIDEPDSGTDLTASEDVTISIVNYGGIAQSNIPVSYQIGNNFAIHEIFTGSIEPGEEAVYTFNKKANLSALTRYRITAFTELENDFDPTNDNAVKSIVHLDCTPNGSDCSQGDGLSYFKLENIENQSIPCADGYLDFTALSTELDRNKSNYEITVQSIFFNTSGPEDEQLSMWIDFNDNGVFDDSERLISSEVIPQPNEFYSYDFSIPKNAPLGEHLLRIRAGDVSIDPGILNSPCEVMSYGTTHDYSVVITDSSIPIKDFILNDADISVISQDQEHFRIFIETALNEPLDISVYNILGQLMLRKNLINEGDGYLYDLDMSYAAPGVYLLRVGTNDFGRVKRFLVK